MSIQKPSEDYRSAEKLDLAAAGRYFTSLGYSVVSVEQWWRHAHGALERDGKRFFFKVASTTAVGTRTKNEVAFYEQIRPLGNRLEAPFRLPVVVASGEWQDLFYFIAEFIPGDPLAMRYPPDTSHLEAWLPKIAEASAVLNSISAQGVALPRDADRQIDNLRRHYLTRASQWSEEIDEPLLDNIMLIVQDLPESMATALGHGDFVPWHMLAEDNKFVLVDAEHASKFTPLGYDVAYCCHRLATSVNSFDLALELVQLYREALSDDLQEKFDDQFRPLMAVRIIGGFWDAKNDQTSFEPHERLARMVLDNTLI
jgi:hypothetical protein